MRQRTNLVAYFLHHTYDYPDDEFLHYKTHDKASEYLGLTYLQVLRQVINLANNFKELGIKADDKVAIFSFNKPQWVISDLAILSVRAVNVPIYPQLAAGEVKELLIASGSKAIIVDSESMLAEVTSIATQCPKLKHIICIDEPANPADLSLEKLSFKKLSFAQLTTGEISELQVFAFDKQVNQIHSQQLASIVYTSGTTGEPKGVMLSHKNFIANVTDILSVIDIRSSDSALSFLPLAHVFERTAGYYCLLIAGGQIYYASNVTTVSSDMLLAHPRIFVGVPLLYERIRSAIEAKITGIKKPLFAFALSVGRQYYILGKRSKWLEAKHWLADKLIYSKLRAKFGGQLRMFVSGGAPLASSTNNFFESLGFPMIEGYGLTETAPVIACNRLEQRKAGSVGLAVAGMQVCLGDDNELLVKGDNVMEGYYNNQAATDEIIDSEGWLHTGDIASIDETGFIYIVDRKKELIVLANGKNVSPLAIESSLTADKYIAQAFVCGNNCERLSALIVPEFDLIASKFNCQISAVNQCITQKEIIDFFAQRIQQACKELSGYERVKHFVILERPFSLETGELTPTLKLKRRVITDKYADLLATASQAC
jgi:long-chain acyl-CoA synthetase